MLLYGMGTQDMLVGFKSPEKSTAGIQLVLLRAYCSLPDKLRFTHEHVHSSDVTVGKGTPHPAPGQVLGRLPKWEA